MPNFALPVQGFRRVEDMSPVVPLAPGSERARRLRASWDRGSCILPPLDVRGVRRNRGLEEAVRDRERAVLGQGLACASRRFVSDGCSGTCRSDSDIRRRRLRKAP